MLEGSLKDFSIEDLLQMISGGEKSGELELSGITPFGNRNGKIVFEHGEIRHAETGESKGEVAAVELLNMKEGNFRFIPKDVSGIVETVRKTIADLTLLAASKIDEWNRIQSKINSVDTIFAMNSEGIPDEIVLNPFEWKVLTLLGKGRSIREVSLEMNMTVIDIANIAYKLAGLKMLKEVGVKSSADTSESQENSRSFLRGFRDGIKRE